MTTTDTTRLRDALVRETPDLLRYFERRVGPNDAPDALGETLLVLWRRLSSLPHDEVAIRMWMFGIARNVVLNFVRSDRRMQALTSRLRLVMANEASDATRDDGIEVRDAISRLTPEQAELVRLIHWDGFTIANAGAILGFSASTARTRYQRARTALKQLLTSDDDPRHRMASGLHDLRK